MKWFVKCLRHYADFSGRARRKEYWMFTLFSVLFLFVWTFLFAFIFVANNFDEDALPIVVYLTWAGLLALPGMAAAVRRLHDLGKSGWWILAGLIPFVGQIWLLVLMCADGQAGVNRFGTDPKTSPETFSDKAKLTSAGVALTVAAIVTIPLGSSGIFRALFHGAVIPAMGWINAFLLPLLLLAVGILLLRIRTRETARPALATLLVWAVIGCSFIIYGLSAQGIIGSDWLMNAGIGLLHFLLIAIFTAVTLFMKGNRGLVRGTALAVIVLEAIRIPLYVYLFRSLDTSVGDGGVILSLVWTISSLLSLIVPSVLIVFAWTFMSKKEESAAAAKSMPEQSVASQPEPTVALT